MLSMTLTFKSMNLKILSRHMNLETEVRKCLHIACLTIRDLCDLDFDLYTSTAPKLQMW